MDCKLSSGGCHRSNEVGRRLLCSWRVLGLDTRKVHVPERQNPIVNRLNKTKIERVVDHEQERVDRLKKESAVRRVEAQAKVRGRSSPASSPG